MALKVIQITAEVVFFILLLWWSMLGTEPVREGCCVGRCLPVRHVTYGPQEGIPPSQNRQGHVARAPGRFCLIEISDLLRPPPRAPRRRRLHDQGPRRALTSGTIPGHLRAKFLLLPVPGRGKTRGGWQAGV